MDINEFIKKCETGTCPRYPGGYNKKTCSREHKRIRCFDKWLRQQEKKKEKREFDFQKKMEKHKAEIKQKEEDWEIKKEQYNNGEIDSLFDIVVDEKDLELKRIIWKRDAGLEYSGTSLNKNWQNYCVFWNHIFTKEEKLSMLNFCLKDKDLLLGSYLDIVHIESRAQRPDLIYNPDNAILGFRFFHSRLDSYLDLVTGEPMSNKERSIWINRMKDYIKSIKYTSGKQIREDLESWSKEK